MLVGVRLVGSRAATIESVPTITANKSVSIPVSIKMAVRIEVAKIPRTIASTTSNAPIFYERGRAANREVFLAAGVLDFLSLLIFGGFCDFFFLGSLALLSSIVGGGGGVAAGVGSMR